MVRTILFPIAAFLLFLSVPVFAMDGNVLYLPFDSDMNDVSGNGLNGTTNGDATIVSGCKFGGCLSVDGDGDYVSVPNDALINFGTDDFSVDFWINIASAGSPFGKVTSIGSNKGFFLEIYGSNQMDFQIYPDGGSGGIYTNEVILGNGWQHVTITRDGLRSSVYVNGSLETYQDDTEDTNVSSDEELTIGMSVEAGYPLNGKIDEFRMWNYALNDTEIEALYDYSAEAPPQSPSAMFFANTTKPIVILLLAIGLGLFVFHRMREGEMNVKTMIGIALTVMIGLAFVMAIGGMA